MTRYLSLPLAALLALCLAIVPGAALAQDDEPAREAAEEAPDDGQADEDADADEDDGAFIRDGVFTPSEKIEADSEISFPADI